MNHQLRNYEIFPRIVQKNETARIIIRPLGDHAAFEPSHMYAVQVLPLTEASPLMEGESSIIYDLQMQPDGTLVLEHTFEGEQEHYIRIFQSRETVGRFGYMTQLSVYSLADDLYRLRPYRGDLHVHTHYSDGREAPAIVASYYRKQGFDFVSVTDHRLYHPSLEAIAAYEDVPIDLLIMPGEEIHPPGCDVHYLNIGGTSSINELFAQNPEMYEQEVREIINTADIPEGINRFAYGACVWAAEKTRAVGGLSIFAHPHWLANVYHVPDALTRALFKNKAFDAFELLGGQSLEENEMQVTLYHQLRSEGLETPVVGSSDSHGCIPYDGRTWFNRTKTVAFAEALSTEGILHAVRNGYSVAVDEYHGKDTYRVHGSYRLVSYTRFLLENYFPEHDELCFEEGLQMKNYMCQNADTAAQALAGLHGRTRQFMSQCFG